MTMMTMKDYIKGCFEVYLLCVTVEDFSLPIPSRGPQKVVKPPPPKHEALKYA
jgi:hypothetical protein